MFLVPQNAGNGIYTFKIFRGSNPPDPPGSLAARHTHFNAKASSSKYDKKLMLNLIVAMQSLVLEASNAMVFFMSNMLKYS